MTCSICGEPSDPQSRYGSCSYCMRIPNGIIEIVGGKLINYSAGKINYNKDNWMLYPQVIERLWDLNRPVQVIILKDRPTFRKGLVLRLKGTRADNSLVAINSSGVKYHFTHRKREKVWDIYFSIPCPKEIKEPFKEINGYTKNSPWEFL